MTFVQDIAYPLNARDFKGPLPDRSLGNVIAAPLSHGSNPNSNAAGRRREDDVNLVTHSLSSIGADASEDGTGRGTPLVTGFHMTQDPISVEDGVPAWGKGNAQGTASVSSSTGVRRLTPTECERLQGLPDGWTLPGSDSKRYAGLGDAVTASVAEWIGLRLLRFEP